MFIRDKNLRSMALKHIHELLERSGLRPLRLEPKQVNLI